MKAAVRSRKQIDQLELPGTPAPVMPPVFIVAGLYVPKRKTIVAFVCQTETEALLRLRKLSPRYRHAAVYCLNGVEAK